MHSLDRRPGDVVTYYLLLNKWLSMRSKTSDH